MENLTAKLLQVLVWLEVILVVELRNIQKLPTDASKPNNARI